ncbi:BREX-1 system phosphatase PglZ type A [Dokdonia sp. Dokd-P16]|uniref:BREX-1 system phosphatase PglZ type A n=1 Tax=Dokdonia sp. Dokd-P16 TaxID=2173169 RepID=UPI000D545008|nr:BREX-1 system phosphatase PglZ type A [Dokdonia sp. Dokd-P16]AWH75512.1 BREX-1 system phosphatase PglZ type A [Dokdonia sp. Dokd-P16]
MLKERIQDYFKNNPRLRVLFFFDKDQEYLEEVDALDLQDIHIEKYKNTPFSTKVKLLTELHTEKVFLYLTLASPATQDAYHNFPLMGLLLANKELQLDNVGEFMERFALKRHQKNLVARYISELKYSGVQSVCEPILNTSNFNETALQRALVSAFLKFKKIESWSILSARLLVVANKEDTNEAVRFVKKVSSLNFEDTVLHKINECTGYAIQELSVAQLQKTAQSVLYNNITQNISKVEKDPYRNLKVEDPTKITQLNQLLYEVERNPNLSQDFVTTLSKAEIHIKGATLLQVYGVDADFAFYTTAMVWDIVDRLQSTLREHPEYAFAKAEHIQIMQPEMAMPLQHMLKWLIYTGRMFQAIDSIQSYVLNKPEQYVEQYTKSWSTIDRLYRLAQNAFKQLDTTAVPETIDTDNLYQDLNVTYEKHTDTLNREWLQCLHQFKFDYKALPVPKQYDFYNKEIAPQDQKVVVIISDALRYEVGEQLLSELHSDTKNTAELRHMLASIPSKTNVGMAQLLPRKTIAFNNGSIEINGINNSGIPNREKVIQSTQEDALALSYSDLEDLDQEERRAIFKKRLVYIYHDIIDNTGDTMSSERRTFEAAKEAILELKLFIKKLHSSYNVAKVFITADHGFLYNDRKIQEKEKERLPKRDMVQSHNRYYLTEDNMEPELGYSIPLSATTVFEENLFVTIPASVNRYRKQGVGHQFVHGGGSLQELVVPLIESSRKREKVTKRVNPILVYKGKLKIVSNILRLNLLQENEVSRYEKQRSVTIGLYKDGTLVSNLEELDLNATGMSPSERMTRIELTLSSEGADATLFKLKVFDKEDTLNPIIEEQVQNNTIITPDF